MAKKAYIVALSGVLLMMTSPAAYTWNQATHAYIANRLGACAGIDNLSEM